MVKGCHIQEENLSFRRICGKVLSIQERSQNNLWITLRKFLPLLLKISAIAFFVLILPIIFNELRQYHVFSDYLIHAVIIMWDSCWLSVSISLSAHH